MRLVTILVMSIAILTALCVAPPVQGLTDPMHIFRTIAVEVWPQNPAKQKDAVTTLGYIFRGTEWNDQHHWNILEHYIRTGGLGENPRSLNQVTVNQAFIHLQSEQHIMQEPVYLRSSLQVLIDRLLKEAKKEKQSEPVQLIGRLPTPREKFEMIIRAKLLRTYAKPLTVEKAQELVDKYKQQTSRNSGVPQTSTEIEDRFGDR